MTILFFDTETTGLPDKRSPVTAKHQPHVVQLAAILTEDDGTERASINLIVNPGVAIPKGASDVHGITDEVAAKYGVLPKIVAYAFRSMVARADLVVAHNIEFDLFLMEALFARLEMSSMEGCEHFCTMAATTPILNLPPTERMLAAGFNKPKPPKLEEAYRHFFSQDLVGAHDALVDVRACRDVFFAVRALERETA